MTTHQLADKLLKFKNCELTVSMDPEECTCGSVRVFGIIQEIMEGTNDTILICTGKFNLSNDEVIDSINGNAE